MSLSDLAIGSVQKTFLPNMMNFLGTWSALTTYYENDVAVEGADSYICLAPEGSLNEQPSTTPVVWLSLTGVAALAQSLSLNAPTNTLSLSGGGGSVDIGSISSIQALNWAAKKAGLDFRAA
jgi:hypothetical protein